MEFVEPVLQQRRARFQKPLALGLQRIGKPWGEAELLCVAEALESRAGFTARPQRWW